MKEKQQNQNRFDIHIWKKLLPFVKPYYGKLALVCCLMVGTAAIDIVIPLFQRYAIDNFISTGSTGGIVTFGVVYALTLVTQALLVVFFSRISMVIEMKLGKDLRRYFVTDFYDDHVKTYSSRPIYWEYSSRTNNRGAFKALVSM